MDWRKRVAVVVLIAGVAWACDEWTLWDDMFKRTAVGPTNRGWTGGDGAFSAPLPNNRELWLFGDSYATSWSAEGYRPQLAQPDGLRYVVFGNTLAVQNDRANPSSTSINFYARAANDACINTAITNITSVAPSNGAYRQFFNHTSLGIPAPPTGTCRFLWPAGAECLDCGSASTARLLISFYEWESCTVGTTGCSEIGTKYTGNAIARFKNLDLAPSGWTLDGATLYKTRTGNTDLTLGVSFLKDTDGKVYIYTYKPVTDELFVARAAQTEVLDDTKWTWWRTVFGVGKWDVIGTIRKVASQVGQGTTSVDRVTRSGTSSYVLVHSRPGFDHMIYARTTLTTSVNGTNTAAAWSNTSATTPRIDVSTIDSSLGWQMFDLIGRNECIAEYHGTPVPDWRDAADPTEVCGMSYHGLAHYETASNDGSGTLGIPVSYVVPFGANPFFDPGQPPGPSNPLIGGQDAKYYRPKYTALDVTKMKPWCTSNCWEGIVKEYPRRLLGSTATSYPFHIASSAKFYAQLTRTAGAATMTVDFYNGFTFLSSVPCTVSAPTVTCNVNKPAGANWANAIINGVASDEFKLRVHYAGSF